MIDRFSLLMFLSGLVLCWYSMVNAGSFSIDESELPVYVPVQQINFKSFNSSSFMLNSLNLEENIELPVYVPAGQN